MEIQGKNLQIYGGKCLTGIQDQFAARDPSAMKQPQEGAELEHKGLKTLKIEAGLPRTCPESYGKL